MSLTNNEKKALLWPIKAKGAVTRFQPLGDPVIEKFYHNSMEQGRFLEASIADANNWLFQKKVLLNEYIISYTHMNSLAVDGQLGHTPRVPKFIASRVNCRWRWMLRKSRRPSASFAPRSRSRASRMPNRGSCVRR